MTLLVAMAPVVVAAEDTGNATNSSPSAEQRGLEIAERMRDIRSGFGGEKATLELVLINSSGDEIARRMRSRTIEMDNDGARSLITFEWPADVEDTQLLTWSHREGADDQWLYLPAIQRVKRISSRNKSGSFMGSEFSYEDLGSQEVEQFTYRYLGVEEIDGRHTWVLERYPRDDLSGYSKQVVWYDKEYGRPLQIHYFDRKEELLKKSRFGDFTKHGQWWREHEITIENVQSHKRSILTWKDRQLGQDYEAESFTRTALGR